jgi:hypothetical protein
MIGLIYPFAVNAGAGGTIHCLPQGYAARSPRTAWPARSTSKSAADQVNSGAFREFGSMWPRRETEMHAMNASDCLSEAGGTEISCKDRSGVRRRRIGALCELTSTALVASTASTSSPSNKARNVAAGFATITSDKTIPTSNRDLQAAIRNTATRSNTRRIASAA